MIYANPGNQPQIAEILYVMDIKTNGAANDEIYSLTDLWATVARYNSMKVMFHRTDLPQRALPIPKAQPIIEQLIREEVGRLKAQWAADPCWDIEDTEGFEEHKEELHEYRLAMEAKWDAESKQKLLNDPAYLAKDHLREAREARDNSWPQSEAYHLQVAQVQAILALVDRLDKMTTGDGSAIRTLSRYPRKP